ncbi:MAG: hypothetical protein ABSF47_03465 [Minisyncoccia bacterium]
MGPERKICQNCKQDFTIEPEDFDFYERIEVPPPTWCPECRLIRRLTFRNARTIYKRRVEGTDKEVISVFSQNSPLKVYSQDLWWSDKWNAMDYGRDYDFTKPFFEQLKDLMRAVPWPCTYRQFSENSEYCINVAEVKDCYLMFNTGSSEGCSYGSDVLRSQRCFDCTKIDGCSLSYGLFDCEKCFKCVGSSHCRECTDVWFSANLTNCRDCVGCVNLRHKQYHIFNKPFTKEEYFNRLTEFKMNSWAGFNEVLRHSGELRMALPVKFMHGFQNNGVQGDYVSHSRNCRRVFYSSNLENCVDCQFILFAPSSNSRDITIAGGDLCYENEEVGAYGAKFTWFSGTAKLSTGALGYEYSMNCFDSHHLFGCVGVGHKEHCILNKQYTKEEYESLLPKIKKHMADQSYVDAMGRRYAYGEFFPSELSPFMYNETLAQDIFPLTKDTANANGHGWREADVRDYKITKQSKELPESIKDVSDSVLDEVIGCEHAGKCNCQCTTAFKITPQELAFYRELGLPLPHLCHNCRHVLRAKQRNPLKLWHRQCMCDKSSHSHSDYCPNEFETSYAPERKEIVYCESCYNSEVV